MTDLKMVYKLKFVPYGQIKQRKIAPYVLDKILRWVNLHAVDPKFVLDLEPKVLKLQGSHLCPKGLI